MNWLNNTFGTLLESPLIQSILILFGFVLLAKITDLVFTRIFKRLVAKTKTNFDDKIIDLLHKPIFYSIIFIGFTFAFKRIDLPDYLDFALVSVVKQWTGFPPVLQADYYSIKHSPYLTIWGRS